MHKRIFVDPSFWILLLVNLYCIYYFQKNPEGFSTIIWAYWIQSVMVGLFNFLDLLTVKNADMSNSSKISNPMKKGSNSTGCSAFFFLFHYQFFHVVYAVFLLNQFRGPIDFSFLLITWAVICFELVMSFIRNKQLQKTISINYGKVFMLPYLRIVPMHLTILAPAFLGATPSTFFLVLKMVADLGMYLIARSLYGRPVEKLTG